MYEPLLISKELLLLRHVLCFVSAVIYMCNVICEISVLLLLFSWLTCLRYVNCEISWFLLHLIMAEQSCFCHQRFSCFLCRAMDGGWDFHTGLPDLSGPSNTPYQDMLNINFEEPGAAAGTPAFQPGFQPRWLGEGAQENCVQTEAKQLFNRGRQKPSVQLAQCELGCS